MLLGTKIFSVREEKYKIKGININRFYLFIYFEQDWEGFKCQNEEFRSFFFFFFK